MGNGAALRRAFRVGVYGAFPSKGRRLRQLLQPPRDVTEQLAGGVTGRIETKSRGWGWSASSAV